jgi:hypothetical protein
MPEIEKEISVADTARITRLGPLEPGAGQRTFHDRCSVQFPVDKLNACMHDLSDAFAFGSLHPPSEP